MASNAAFFALIATWVGRPIKTCSRSDKPDDRDTSARDDGFDVDGFDVDGEGEGEGDGEGDDDFDFDFDGGDDVLDFFAGDIPTPSVRFTMTLSTWRVDDRFYARACVHSCARVYLRVRYVWDGTKVSRK